VHFSSMLTTIGIIFPYLKRILPLPLSMLIASFTFPIYHLAQFHFFPSGLRAKFQFQIFCFSLSYVLFYELTGSFMLTFVLQHLIATTTFIYNQDYEFGRRDFPFYFGIFIVASAIIFCSIWLRWLFNFFAFLAMVGSSVFVLVPPGIIALKDVAST
jgi:hypothetical protein